MQSLTQLIIPNFWNTFFIWILGNHFIFKTIIQSQGFKWHIYMMNLKAYLQLRHLIKTPNLPIHPCIQYCYSWMSNRYLKLKKLKPKLLDFDTPKYSSPTTFPF